MIYSYGVTRQGAYHVKKNVVCQDAHKINVINKGFAIAAVADGLGSELYTDVASKIAVEASTSYCVENINEEDSEQDILRTIKESFSIALNKINDTADAEGHDKDQYDTTLALAVYIKGNVFFGNSGDSGIIVLNADGTYESITTQQRDENGCVFPLFFGEDKWEFGTKKNVASILLATDGMYETFFPYLLKDEEVNIYVALVHYMMNNSSLRFSDSANDDVQTKMENFIDSISGEQVSDDKTVVVLVDDEVKAESQPDEYYKAPDWEKLRKKRDEDYKRAAYPHLFKE